MIEPMQSTNVLARMRQMLDEMKHLVEEVRSSARTLTAAAIGRGGLTVKDGGRVVITDEAGNDQVRLGPLLGGGYGLEQLVGANWVPLAALAGGASAASVAGSKLIEVDGGETTSWETGGGAVTFTTHTGKWLLLVVASSVYYGAVFAELGFSSTGAQAISPSSSRRAQVVSKGYDENSSQIYAELISGAPGQITVQPRYRAGTVNPNFDGYAEWTNRTTIVLPF